MDRPAARKLLNQWMKADQLGMAGFLPMRLSAQSTAVLSIAPYFMDLIQEASKEPAQSPQVWSSKAVIRFGAASRLRGYLRRHVDTQQLSIKSSLQGAFVANIRECGL
jgi:hypothetical protein